MNTSDSGRPIGIRLGATVAAALTTAALAAGCGSSSSTAASAGSGSAGGASASTTARTGTASSSSTAAASPASGASGQGAAASSSSLPPKPTGPAPGGPRDCSTDMLKLAIQALREPINHVMISATNTSQIPCHLNKYPLLRTFGAQQTPIAVADATKPASAILLAPGATAYAGVMTNSADGSGTDGRNIATLQVQLQPSGSGGGVGRTAAVPMPPGAQYIDSSAVVTYWESDIQSATY